MKVLNSSMVNNEVVLDISKLNNLRHLYLREKFPLYQDDNFDAFYDCISSYSQLRVFLFNKAAADDFSKMIIDILYDASKEYPEIEII